MGTIIALAGLAPELRRCLRTAHDCSGLLACKVGYVGRDFGAGQTVMPYAGSVVGQLARRGLLHVSNGGGAADLTAAGRLLLDAGAVTVPASVRA